MKKIILPLTILIILFSCKTNKGATNKKSSTENNRFETVNLDAHHRSNDEIKLIYNSIDTIPTTLIVNKNIIQKSKVKSVLDTLKMQNYIININKEKRIIELISK